MLLDLILRLRRRRRLPLHVARRIRATALQGLHMVDHVTRARAGSLAGGWAGMRLLELMLGRGCCGRCGPGCRARMMRIWLLIAVQIAASPFAVRDLDADVRVELVRPRASAVGATRDTASRAKTIRYMGRASEEEYHRV